MVERKRKKERKKERKKGRKEGREEGRKEGRKKERKKEKDVENKCIDTKGGKRGPGVGGGMNWEIGIDIYTLIYIK